MTDAGRLENKICPTLACILERSADKKTAKTIRKKAVRYGYMNLPEANFFWTNLLSMCPEFCHTAIKCTNCRPVKVTIEMIKAIPKGKH